MGSGNWKWIKGQRGLIVLVISFLTFLGGVIASQASDFVIAIDENSRIYYAASNGDGTFSDYGQIDFLGGTNTRGVTINDFNNDSHMDFVAGRGISGTGYYYLFLNDGSNHFIKTALVGTQSNANSWAMDMASGDFNNDGYMDFIANGNQSTTGIYLGDGKGNFTKAEMNLGAYGRGMDTADFNHDGNLDIVRAMYSSGYIYVYFGDGTGAFPASLNIGDVGDDPYGVVAGDFNNDGNNDVIANSGSSGDTYFFAGNGDGTFMPGVYTADIDTNTHGGFDAYDYNGDGKLDLIIATHDNRQIRFYPGNGDGTFGSAGLIGTTSGNCMGISAMPIGPPVGVPQARISPASAFIAVGASVDFDGSGSSDSDGTLTSWIWDFGNSGVTLEAEDPSAHTYAAEGSYHALLKVTDDEGKSDYDSAKVLVQGDVPAVDSTPVTFDETYADDGLWSLTLDGADYATDTEGIVSYLWNLDDGLTEDFEDGNADGWAVFAGTWEVYDTDPDPNQYSYSYHQTDSGPDRTWTLFDKNFDTDIIIEADVELLAGSGEEAQVLFRAVNEMNNYEFILRGRGNNDVLLYKRQNGSTTNLFEYDLPPNFTGPSYPIDLGHSYQIKIVCIGSRIDFYLDGTFLFSWYDSTFMSGKVGFSTYRSEALFDNLSVVAIADDQNPVHAFTPGLHNVGLTVSDAAGQTATGIIPMTMQPGDTPTAIAGGPYAAGESAATGGGWTISLDGSGSSDDVEVKKYIWDLGTDVFTGTSFNWNKWFTNGDIAQNDDVSLTGVNTWDTRYMVSKSLFPKVKGQIFQARIKTPGSGQSMFGFKNSNTTNFHYNQFPYEFYLYNGNINIYENSSSRGDTGYDYSYNTWYDFKIELKDTGAVYSYRPSGTTHWVRVYDSDYVTGDTELRKGIVVYSNTWYMDDFRETTAGETSNFTVYRTDVLPQTFGIDLTVCDRAGQSDTSGTTVEISGGDFPTANAGADQNKAETDASGGVWTVNFDASSSTDDHGVYTYEWDWNYDGSTFHPSGDVGVTSSHSWTAPGTYTVAVRVTDNALQRRIDTMTVNISQGDPPTADAGGPYTVDEFSGNVFEGAWVLTLDGTESSDAESNIERFFWNLGTETFNGTQFLGGKWYTNGGVSQDDAVAVTGANNWGDRYIVSRGTVPKESGQIFQARIKDLGTGDAMLGFKNSSTTNFSYTQFPYQFYLYNRNIYIYEYSSSRGDTGYNIASDTWYDFKIELTNAGAVYSYKPATSTDWTVVYTSTYQPSETDLRKGMVVNNGTFMMDDFVETAGGPEPTVYLSGLGSHTIPLTVYDQADQSDTDSSSITTSVNEPPVADAGPDRSGDEADAFENTWTFDFDASGSTDDFGIYKYEWDWGYDGSFDPSSDSGITASHTFSGAGTYTVALRVTDHGLQSSIDTVTVTLTNGDPPVAEAGPDMTTEGHWPVVFNGGNSTDDSGIIYKYEWDFGDGKTGVGRTPTHIYWNPGEYAVTLTVYDNALQTGSDTMTVHVLAAADGPVADAGGPYNAGAGGPPAYFNGSLSTDDHGIVKYLWDADITVDSDGDGVTDNDVDVVGRKPFYTYATAGSYTAKLSVVDGADQTSTATATVNVADNLAPDVICVPWQAGDPTIPHETYNGRSIRLKAIVRDAGNLTYQWNFGDGSAPSPATPAAISNKYAVEAIHAYPNSADGTPYTATLTVWDGSGLVGSDQYYVIVRSDSLEVRTNIAIDEGLWYIHKTQKKTDGHWESYGSYYTSPTASSIQAFEINGHLQDGDNQENPYVQTVNTGFEYMFTKLSSYAISTQTYGNPDSNGNGIGIGVGANDRPIYEGGMVMDAIASSNKPLGFATTGSDNISGRYYYDILNDMVDMYAYGQVDSGSRRGGWRYSWNSDADNSACQWAAIGMLAAEDTFGINIPQWIKDENDIWLNTSYDGTGFGYTGSGNGVATTPSGMVQLAFDDKYTSDPRWKTAEDYIANNWFWQNSNYYAIYALVKAMRLAKPQPVVTLNATGLDWYNDPITGVNKRIVDQQATSGSYWGSWDYGQYGGRGLDTAWAVIMLTPTLFVQPAVADAGDDIIWAYDRPLIFDASGSFHMDPSRSIVKYEWDFEGDGTYDFITTDPSDPNAKYTYADPDPDHEGNPPQVFIAKLRVTDDNEPPQTDIDTREVTVAEPPHAPFARHGGPYNVTAGIPFTLDGSGSYDIDPGDSIKSYEWDLDNDGVWFDDIDLITLNATESYTYNTPGVYNIGLRVWDNGAFNPIGCEIGVDCDSMMSEPVYTTVTVNANQPPKANAGGPYTINEGTPLTLDGSGSSDPNGDALSYAWDLDNDSAYDDATGAVPIYTWSNDGTYTVGLKVSDGLLENTATAEVVVNDLAPTAAFSWTPELQVEGTSVQFTDESISSPDLIVSWSWDFGGLGTSSDRNPSFIFQDNGTYTVTLTVTDDDGSTNNISHTVTISDAGPTAAFTWSPEPQIEGGTIQFTDESTSAPDVITGWDWDFGDGSTESGNAPSHVYADNGNYTVKLTVTDDDGSTASVTHTVYITDLGPTASLSGDNTLDEGQSGNYDAGGSTSGGPDGITSFEWDWNYDGSTFVPSGATGSNQSHTFSQNGTYVVAVRVTDDDGSTDIVSLMVTVNDVSPSAAFNWSPEPQTEGSPVFFTDTSTSGSDSITAWAWNFGGLETSTDQNPSFAFADNGTYTVTLTVTDADGSTNSISHNVNIDDVGPAASLTGDTTLNEGQTGNYDASGSTSNPDGIATYEWDWTYDGLTFNASGDTGETASHVYNDNGTYTAAVLVTDDDGSQDVATLPVTVNNLPPVVNAGSDQTASEGQTVGFNGSFTDPGAADTHTIEWDFGDGETDSGTLTPSHAYSSAGTYTVTLTVTDDDGGVGTDTLTVTVSSVSITVDAGPDQTVNEGDAVIFSGSFTDPGGSISHDYQWDFGDGSAVVTGTLTPTHVYEDNGVYTVTLSVTGGNGSGGSHTLIVTVNNVAPTVNAGDDQTVNVGDTASFNGSFTDPGMADTQTITWDFGDDASASGSLNPSHPYTTAGIYTVTLTVTDDDGGVGTDTLTVTVETAAPICGDLDGDGDVDITDRSIFMSTYGKIAGQPGYIPAADYDGDNRITMNDYREWYRCYIAYINS